MIDTSTIDTSVRKLLTEESSVTLSPSYEGANIGTYIGFKHVNYLIEKAVIEHFRAAGLPVGELYQQYGLGFDVVDLAAKLRGGMYVDDQALLRVRPVAGDPADTLGFQVSVFVPRNGESKKIVTGSVKAVLRLDEDVRRLPDRLPTPVALAPFTVREIGPAKAGAEVPGPLAPLVSGGTVDHDPVLDQLLAGRNGYGWRMRVPYPYVHFFERVQMTAYLRLMEEAKHRFVDSRGISIGRQLGTRNWIPLVTESRIEMVGEALLEEDLYCTYEVTDIFKNLHYTSRMDCHVVRDGRLLQVATGTITHGYAVPENGNQARIVSLDDTIMRALRGTGDGPA
ncbi:hypothetical protein [Streptomyces hygroscopicus]|uniref:hypothetical protein n=1 Tax=Streptomyces hygroscopicus TaxID=1912 RepID=UPI00223EF934|nr:hypothetical protein [Streptomyces hygroscopicus]